MFVSEMAATAQQPPVPLWPGITDYKRFHGYQPPMPGGVHARAEVVTLSSTPGSIVTKMNDEIVVKFGPRVTLNEAQCMSFLNTHAVPLRVPQILAYYRHTLPHQDSDPHPKTWTYIFMRFVDGTTLHEVWHLWNDEKKEVLVEQLHFFFRQLRDIKQSSNPFVGSFEGPVNAFHMTGQGRFSNVENFNLAFARYDQTKTQDDLFQMTVYKMLQENRYDIHLTHGELHPENVMVLEDGTITGIIGWRCAGWYPAYWEFTTAMVCSNRTRNWVDYLVQFLDPYYGPCAIAMIAFQ